MTDLHYLNFKYKWPFFTKSLTGIQSQRRKVCHALISFSIELFAGSLAPSAPLLSSVYGPKYEAKNGEILAQFPRLQSVELDPRLEKPFFSGEWAALRVFNSPFTEHAKQEKTHNWRLLTQPRRPSTYELQLTKLPLALLSVQGLMPSYSLPYFITARIHDIASLPGCRNRDFNSIEIQLKPLAVLKNIF